MATRFFLFAFVAFAFTLNVVLGQCADRWVYFQDSCYVFVEDHMSWTSALEVCEVLSSSLVEITSAAEASFVKAMARNHSRNSPGRVWTGGNDLVFEGDWRWIGSGEKMQFTDWYPGDPNNVLHPNNHDEDCVEMYPGNKLEYKWLDADCTGANLFICETESETNPAFG